MDRKPRINVEKWKKAIILTMDHNSRRDVNYVKINLTLPYFEFVFVDNLVDVEQPLLSFQLKDLVMHLDSISVG